MAMNIDRSSTSSVENTSQTFSIYAGFYIQCFALNYNATQVIATTKMSSRLFQIDDEKKAFTLKANYSIRDTKSFCIRDISWSRLDESLVVSCGSNGELHKWKVSQSEFKPEYSLQTSQKHTLNKVTCHPNDVNLLLTGGQDGIIELYDLRTKEKPSKQYRHDGEEKVTDIQICPHSGSWQFASGSDIGNVYIWDIRSSNTTKMSKYKPHMNEVHLDWHPEERSWLATASRERQMHVFDTAVSSSTAIYSLMHSETVASIKWRPKRRTQITACSSSPIDSRLHVWDLDRPFLPYASFDTVNNKYHNFLWRNSPKLIIASAKEWLFNLSINDALRPADHSTLVAVNIDKYGAIAFAVGDEPPKPPSLSFSERSEYRTQTIYGSYDSASYSHIITTPNQSTTTNARFNDNDSETNAIKFRITQSKMLFDDAISTLRSDWFLQAAIHYKFKNDTFENLCDHNGSVALKHNKFSIYKNWMILKAAYKDSKTNEYSLAEIKNTNTSGSTGALNNENFYTSNLTQLRRSSDSSVTSYGQCFPDNSSTPDVEPATDDFYNYKIDDEDDSSILPTDIEFNEINDLFDDYINDKSSQQIDNPVVTELLMSPNNQSNNNAQNTDTSDLIDGSNSVVKDFKLNILSKYTQPEIPKLNFDQHFQEVLFNYINDENDLATAITMLLVACRSGKYQKSNIEDIYLNEWFSQYIEMLAKFELWNLRVDIIKSHQSEFIINLTQKSLNYIPMCANCKKQIKQGTFICPKCNKNPFLCSYCHLPVRDLYTWCHTCYHGGHLHHLEEWFKKYNKCPSGCGCNCWNN